MSALRALLVLALTAACGLAAAQPPAQSPSMPAAKKKAVRPAWAELTAEQQQILAPLKADWESLDSERRRKWLGIAKRYPAMKPEEQARVQRRMQTWAKLTPEQRRQARENYKRMAKSGQQRGKLREHWAEYQLLPPQEREELAPPAQPQPRR